jgi:hypothetical protein
MRLLLDEAGIQLYESCRHFKIGYTVEAVETGFSVGVITSNPYGLLKKLDFATAPDAMCYISCLETLTLQEFKEEIQL